MMSVIFQKIIKNTKLKRIFMFCVLLFLVCCLFYAGEFLETCLPSYASASQAPSTLINQKDGAVMIHIPAGVSYLGALDNDQLADASERPLRAVYLDDFYIYKYEVTLAQFKKFADDTGYITEGEKNTTYYTWRDQLRVYSPDTPAGFISWSDAKAYCQWAGGKLPTEAQWEKAGRGDKPWIYPWGNDRDDTRFNNELELEPEQEYSKSRSSYVESPDSFAFGLKPVGSFPQGDSAYGVSDMLGNVWEWCEDWYQRHHTSSELFVLYSPSGPKEGRLKIVKGGGFCDDPKNYRISCRDRNLPNAIADDYGFRVVIEPVNTNLEGIRKDK